MTIVNTHEAKTHLSKLLLRVNHGEEIIIARAGKPVARLLPFQEEGEDRIPGLDRGLFTTPNDFDLSLPPDILKDFEV